MIPALTRYPGGGGIPVPWSDQLLALFPPGLRVSQLLFFCNLRTLSFSISQLSSCATIPCALFSKIPGGGAPNHPFPFLRAVGGRQNLPFVFFSLLLVFAIGGAQGPGTRPTGPGSFLYLVISLLPCFFLFKYRLSPTPHPTGGPSPRWPNNLCAEVTSR